MRRREAVLLAALTVALSALTGLLYAGFGRPVATPTLVPAPTPVDWGYSVGPGWQTHAAGVATVHPWPTATTDPAALALPPDPTGSRTPTSVWLQPGRDVSCQTLSQIVQAAMTYRNETLWASELAEPHVAQARQVEPGAQLTRIHTFSTSAGTWSFILFQQALIVWKPDAPRILIASPVNGCWQGVGIPTPTP